MFRVRVGVGSSTRNLSDRGESGYDMTISMAINCFDALF